MTQVVFSEVQTASPQSGTSVLMIKFVSTNASLTAVLAEELTELKNIDAESIDITWVEKESCHITSSDVVVVTEAAIGRWRRCVTRAGVSLPSRTVIGMIGTQSLGDRSALDFGFDGSVDLRSPARMIADELRVVYDSNIQRRFVHMDTRTSTETGLAFVCLDTFDRRILAFLTMGLSDREISSKVHLSPQTVRNRVSRMLDRAHVSNRTQLAMACVKFPKLLDVYR